MGSFPEGNCLCCSDLVKIFEILRGTHQHRFYIYFGGFIHLDGYYLIVCCSLGPVLVI